MQLDNTAAIVTGGASGLGAATARALAAKGASVYALDLRASIDTAGCPLASNRFAEIMYEPASTTSTPA